MNENELHNMMRDPRYWRDRDPEFIARVTAGFRELFAPFEPTPEPDPAADLATLRARVAELEDALEIERSNTAFEQAGLQAMRLDRDNFRQRLAASEASPARLVRRLRAIEAAGMAERAFRDCCEPADIQPLHRALVLARHEAEIARTAILPGDLAC